MYPSADDNWFPGLLPWLGHNGGPPLDDHVPEWGENGIGGYFDWKRAHRRAWRSASRSVALFRLDRAERVGLTYQEYTSEILDRGRYLQVEDEARLAEIKVARKNEAAATMPRVPPIPTPDAAPTTQPLDFRRIQLAKLQKRRPRGR